MLSGAKACKSCRSRQEFSNEYLLEQIGFNTAENEPVEVCQKLQVAKSQTKSQKKIQVFADSEIILRGIAECLSQDEKDMDQEAAAGVIKESAEWMAGIVVNSTDPLSDLLKTSEA